MDWLFPPADWIYPSANWLNPPADKASPPTIKASQPVNEASPFGFLYFFSFFSSSLSQVFDFCQQNKFYRQNQRRKLLILRPYVDLLNRVLIC